jgi:predicted RNA binding protein YcfA (HicA-like mRNA interferase family)
VKLPRDLEGRTLVKALCRDWDYREVNQTGSHIILQTETPSHQRIPVPDHSPIRIGTLNNILRLVADHKGWIEKTFYARSKGCDIRAIGQYKVGVGYECEACQEMSPDLNCN